MLKLLDAHRLINEASTSGRPVRRYALATGFTPLALETFVRAHLQQRRSTVRVDVEVGRFGDLGGNVERATEFRQVRIVSGSSSGAGSSRNTIRHGLTLLSIRRLRFKGCPRQSAKTLP